MQELINSAARFTAAMTIFGIQEFQNAFDSAMESKPNLDTFRESLDRISQAVAGELNSDHKPTLDSVTHFSDDWVDRTFKAIDSVEPGRVLKTANNVMRKTADALSGKKTEEKAEAAKPGAPKPKAA